MNNHVFPTLFASVFTLVFSSCSGADADAVLGLSSEPYVLVGSVLEDEDVSTISLGKDSFGILASDEGAVIQLLSFSDDLRSPTILANVALAQPDDLEIDFEASAFLDGWFYITGSHGVAKKKGVYEEPRTRIFRFRLNPDGSGIRDLESSSLAPLFSANPTLAPFHRLPLQQKGLNVEGLAARDGHLFVGFRAPNIEGNAFVMKVAPDAVFSDNPSGGELMKVRLEEGLGIRAMDAVKDGFLIVAGNAGAEPSKDQPITTDYIEGRPSALYYWEPASGEATRLGVLPKRGKGKEEAIVVLSAEPGEPVEALLLYDSIPRGGATLLAIELPE